MIALDANVIVRFLTADEPVQARRSANLIKREKKIYVPATVLLEVAWVLRSAYLLSDENINSSLRRFLSLPQVEVENRAATQAGLHLHSAGMDFADALHLSSSMGALQFATFDRKLRALAKKFQAPKLPIVFEP